MVEVLEVGYAIRVRAFVAVVLAMSMWSAVRAETASPYAGQEARSIKALSAKDINDLLAGRGWGFAKPAELNGYPGPAHVLDLKAELALDPNQISAIEAIFTAMEADARMAGAAYVEAERALDVAFAAQTVDAQTLDRLAKEAARLRGAVRAVHLRAHLDVKPLLSRHQIGRYNELRGYGAPDHRGGHHGHATHN